MSVRMDLVLRLNLHIGSISFRSICSMLNFDLDENWSLGFENVIPWTRLVKQFHVVVIFFFFLLRHLDKFCYLYVAD